jgi:hypothetical protein
VNAGEKRRSGGDPVSQEVMRRREEAVEELLVQGTPMRVVCTILAAEQGMSQTTCYRYAERVRTRWKAEHLLRSETAREERLLQLQKAREEFANDRKPNGQRYDATVARYDEMINDILGVAAPQQVQVSGAVDVNVNVSYDLSNLDEEEFRALETISAKIIAERPVAAAARTLPEAAGVALRPDAPAGADRGGEGEEER